MKLFMSLLLLSSTLLAQTLTIPEYNYVVRDVRERNLSKEFIYQEMNRVLVRSKDSICSNRAHVWGWDFHLNGIESPKIFLFFTAATGRFDGVTWWYHVSPLINEGGKLWVMDAGYPSRVSKPLSVKDWLKTFNGEKSVCKKIESTDTELLQLMYRGNTFPENTRHGKYNCYYRITPPGYWVPSQIARNLLGKSENGESIQFDRDVINEAEVFSACTETATTPIGYVLLRKRGQCRYFMTHGSLELNR